MVEKGWTNRGFRRECPPISLSRSLPKSSTGPDNNRRLRMRNLQRIGIALVLLAAVSAVGLASPDLEKTPQAKAFRAQMKAIAAGDYEAYKKVTTADTLKQMDSQLKQMGKTSKDG